MFYLDGFNIMYFESIKFANWKELVTLKIYTNPLIRINLDNGELGWVHASKIKEIVNSYKQQESNTRKKTSFLGEVFYFLDLS